MNSAVKTLLRTWLSLIALSAVSIQVAMMFGPWVLVHLVGLSDEVFRSRDLMRTFFVSYIAISFFAFNAVSWGPLSSLHSHARLIPLETRTLGLFLLLVPTAIAALMNGVTITMYNVLFNGDWPVAVTSVWFAVTILVGASGLAWLGTAAGRFAILAPAASSAWIFYIVWQFYPNGFRTSPEFWTSLSPVQAGCIGIVAATSMLVFLSCWAKYRRGDSAAVWLARLGNTEPGEEWDSPPAEQNFLTPEDSFCSMARRQVRALTLGLQGGLLLFGTAFCYVCLRVTSKPLDGLVATTPMFAAMAGIGIGVLMGMEVWLHKTGGLKTYIATLPVEDSVLGRLVLRSWVPLLLLTWGAFLISVLLAIALHSIFEGPRDYIYHYSQLRLVRELGAWSGLLWLFGTPLIAWTTAGILGAIGLSGQQRLSLWSIVLFFAMTTIIMWCWVFGGPTGLRIGQGLLFAITVIGCVGLTIWLVSTAAVRDLITRHQAIGCTLTGLIACVTAWMIIPGGSYWQAVGAGTVSLLVAPVAAMPLALAANRHR